MTLEAERNLPGEEAAAALGVAYTTTWHSYKFKGPLRFCAEAYDPSGNESSRSCAPIVTSRG